MEFEKQLRDKLRGETIRKIEEDFQRRWNEQQLFKEDIKSDSIENAYSIYIENKMKAMPKEQLYSLYDEFEQAVSVKALMIMKEKIELEEQEKTYIKYNEQCRWLQNGRQKSHCRSSNTKSFVRKNRVSIHG